MSAADLATRAYDQHGPELYRFARRWTGNDATAQDLVQDVIVRAWRAAERFDDRQGSLRTWLFAIARNTAVDYQRAATRRGLTNGALALVPPPPSDAVLDHVIRCDLVARALEGLSSDHRTAIVETYLRDRPTAEVAAELNINQSTLRSRIFHGLRALRTTMERMEGT